MRSRGLQWDTTSVLPQMLQNQCGVKARPDPAKRAGRLYSASAAPAASFLSNTGELTIGSANEAWLLITNPRSKSVDWDPFPASLPLAVQVYLGSSSMGLFSSGRDKFR